jgi:hypothetical protein
MVVIHKTDVLKIGGHHLVEYLPICPKIGGQPSPTSRVSDESPTPCSFMLVSQKLWNERNVRVLAQCQQQSLPK